MVHPTLDKKESLAVKGDASKMDKKQDAEVEKMVTMLDQRYKDAYTPKVMPALCQDSKGNLFIKRRKGNIFTVDTWLRG